MGCFSEMRQVGQFISRVIPDKELLLSTVGYIITLKEFLKRSKTSK